MKLLQPVLLAAALGLGSAAMAAPLTQASGVKPVDDSVRVTLRGNTHRLASAANDRGPLDPGTAMPHIVMVLKRTPAQEAALEAELSAQLDPQSPEFHKWMKPVEFGQRFGVSDASLARITQWLESHGFHIDGVANGRGTLTFSGTAGQVNEAFQVTMRHYQVRGASHIANDRDPSIPAELASSVTGLASLNDLYYRPHVRLTQVQKDPKTGKFHPVESSKAWVGKPSASPKPDFTGTDSFGDQDELVTPFDAATIYNYKTLWSQGITGAGQTIAITGSSDVSTADFNLFRSTFGLPATTLQTIQTGSDPGYTDARGENSMDTELAGGAAPEATVVLVVSGDTNSTPGFLTSAEYIVDNDVASVMSTSYGGCELDWGTSGNELWASIWKQADAEGISSFVSSGDSGSDSCDSQDAIPNAASSGMGVSALASTPYATAVGGTDFFWQNSPSTYWSASNDSTTHASALGYVPEVPWNSTCTSPVVWGYEGGTDAESFCNAIYEYAENTGDSTFEDYWLYLDSGNGGVSSCTAPTGTTPSTCAGGYAKPSWQIGTGVPNDGKRDVPDVSLLGSGGIADVPFSAWLICDSENNACTYNTDGGAAVQASGGTSASSPEMAGIMALIQQKEGGAQGLINPVLYSLFNKETVSNCASLSVNTTSNSCVFYDITANTNSQVCFTGSPDCVTETSGDPFGTLEGYNSGTGYDFTTGLGSINVANLAAAWSGASSRVATTTTLTSSSNPTAINTAVNFTATVKKSSGSGTPTGTVTFTYEGTPLGTVTLASGSAQLTGVQFQGAGTYPIVATYTGDGSDAASTSNTLNETVNAPAVNTTTTLSASPTSVATGGSVKFTATVKAASGSTTPTGTVTFTFNGASIGSASLSSGTASVTTTVSLAAGSYTAKATYAGATGFNSSTSSNITITVTGAAKVNTTTSFTASPNPITVNATGTLSATVKKASGSGTPTGTVTFYYGTEAIAQATLSNGVASTSAQAAVPAGTYALHAVYNGDAADNASTSNTVNETVSNASKSNTTVTASANPNPVKSGSVTGVTVEVTGGSSTPTGTITYSYNGETFGTATLSNGFAATGFTVSLPAGTYTINIGYGGDSTHNSSTTTLKITVTAS